MANKIGASGIAPFPLKRTKHAQARQQQRGISNNEIRAVLLWGRTFAQGCGRVAFFLGRRECERAAKEGISLWATEGTAVIESSDGSIVTVIRSSSPTKIKKMHLRKPKQEEVLP